MISREGSSNINLNESLISESSSNFAVREEENHLTGNNRLITDNRKTREKYKQILNRTKQIVHEPTRYFKETLVFAPKSTSKPPKGYPNLEVFLSQIEKELFELAETSLGYSNFCKEEWIG